METDQEPQDDKPLNTKVLIKSMAVLFVIAVYVVIFMKDGNKERTPSTQRCVLYGKRRIESAAMVTETTTRLQ